MLPILIIIWLGFMAMLLIGFFGTYIAQRFAKGLLDLFICMISIGFVGTVAGFLVWFIVEFILTIIEVL